jgi:hypothetical protein
MCCSPETPIPLVFGAKPLPLCIEETCCFRSIAQTFLSMDKPIVFLSHSSKDREQLGKLKSLLEKRSAKSLEFFLSSDGQSIRFGRNWVVRISDALSNAKLMFLFISPHSVDSKWVHFEAGSAYARNIDVVPVCLPGVDLDQLTPPLSHLQGFNLHRYDQLGNLARICNLTCDLAIDEAFLAADFDVIFSIPERENRGFFGSFSDLVSDVQLTSQFGGHASSEELVSTLVSELKSAELEVVNRKPDPKTGNHRDAEIQFSGGFTWISIEKDYSTGGTETSILKAYTTLAPELFHLTAPAFEKWHQTERVQIPHQVAVRISGLFRGGGHELSTRLFKSGINFTGWNQFSYRDFNFSLPEHKGAFIEFETTGPLLDDRLPSLIGKLVETGAIQNLGVPESPSSFWFGNKVVNMVV